MCSNLSTPPSLCAPLFSLLHLRVLGALLVSDLRVVLGASPLWHPPFGVGLILHRGFVHSQAFLGPVDVTSGSLA